MMSTNHLQMLAKTMRWIHGINAGQGDGEVVALGNEDGHTGAASGSTCLTVAAGGQQQAAQ